MRVYNEPCEMTVDGDGRPRSFPSRGCEYSVVAPVEDWQSMRPWWRETLPDPMDHRVFHYRVRA